MNLIAALQVQQRSDRLQFFKGSTQVLDCAREFRGRS
jgi:hypothetical protein